MIKRGIYYAAREISSQLNYVTEQTNYSDVSKVISIWIINDDSISLDLQNTATRYYFTKEDFIGVTDEPREDYDLLEVIMIRRGERKEITDTIFIVNDKSIYTFSRLLRRICYAKH